MARWDTVQVDGQPMRVYLDAPRGAGPFPAVLVAQHGMGVDKFIEDRVEKLAQHGYLAAAPDLYHRQPEDGADMMTRIGRLRDKEIIADVNSTIAHVQSLKDARVSRFGITGFCMGGRVAYLLAASNPIFKAAGVFYGGNIMKPWGDGPAPFELTRNIACPVAGFFGEDDTNPSPTDVKKIGEELDKFKTPREFHSYAGAGHAFLNFLNPQVYREPQGQDAWEKLLLFFNKHLK